MVFGKYWMKNMKVSSKESEKNTNKRGWVVSLFGTIQPHVVLCLLLMLQTPIRSEKRIRMNQRIQLMVTLLSLFIHDDLLVKDAVGAVKIHNPILIQRRKEDTGDNAMDDKIPLDRSIVNLSPISRQVTINRIIYSDSYPSIHTVNALDSANFCSCAAMQRLKKSNTRP